MRSSVAIWRLTASPFLRAASAQFQGAMDECLGKHDTMLIGGDDALAGAYLAAPYVRRVDAI